MSLLDKLHDKALSATKKHVKYPLLIASGIADWIAGTYGEMKGHGEAAKASGEEDYRLYDEGHNAAAFGETGAFAAAVYTRNKAGAAVLGADILVRCLNGAICLSKGEQLKKEDPGVIGTARTLAYKLANRRKRPDVAAEPAEDDGAEVAPPIFPDPLPDEMRILGGKPGRSIAAGWGIVEDEMRRITEGKLEEKVSDAGAEEPGDDVLPFEPAPIPALAEELPPGPFVPKSCPEPLRLPGPGKGYELPDIMEPEDKPDAGYHPLEIPGGEVVADKPGDDAPQAPSSKPKVDIGPLSTLPDDEDPLGSADEEETGNKLF